MAADGSYTNDQFELRGFDHVALVCRDTAETVARYEVLDESDVRHEPKRARTPVDA